jgi:hypothetical protein
LQDSLSLVDLYWATVATDFPLVVLCFFGCCHVRFLVVVVLALRPRVGRPPGLLTLQENTQLAAEKNGRKIRKTAGKFKKWQNYRRP